MALTEAQLRELYPRAADAHIKAFAAQNGALFARFGIDRTADRLHFFLAQIGHESGGLTIGTENLNYSAGRLVAVWPSRFPDEAAARPFARNPEKLANNVYADRMGNGPPESGDGWRYRGRGYVQITGKDGYAQVGRRAELDLVANPDLVSEPEHALLAVCAFWDWKGLNERCDTGDFVKVTRRINGGTNGLDDRRAWLEKARRILAAPAAAEVSADPPDVVEIQRALRDAGYPEVGAADGQIGPKTTAAIVRFRRDRGLAEGFVDGALLKALGLSD